MSAFSQRLRKYTFTAVHTKTHKRRFQIYPLRTAFSNLCVYGERFHRLPVDGRPKGIKKFALTSVCVYNHLRVDGASITSHCSGTQARVPGRGEYLLSIVITILTRAAFEKMTSFSQILKTLGGTRKINGGCKFSEINVQKPQVLMFVTD